MLSLKHPRTVKLHKLMADHDLNGPAVAELLNRSLKTVHCWRSQSSGPIPAPLLELLELKILSLSLNEDK